MIHLFTAAGITTFAQLAGTELEALKVPAQYAGGVAGVSTPRRAGLWPGAQRDPVGARWYPFGYTKWVCCACPVGNTVWLRENLDYRPLPF
ncbi:MAG: hypothetical protein MAG431_01240 [Chloroflexi bacterium]|nr:hypothetical protein [Chloroflexota bacterium]